MAGLAPLIGEMAGPERASIEMDDDGLRHSVHVGDTIEFEIEDIVPFGKEDGQPVKFDGMFHPVASDLTMAGKCRSPLGFLLGTWRDGWRGGMGMGARNGVWCVGCCWALMAALFALGIMSVLWMAFVAGLIALEKTLPWRRTATYSVAAVLLGLAVLVLATPDIVPGLTEPSGDPMS